MDAKKREQVIQILLPAAAVLAIYAIFVNMPQQSALKVEKQRAEAARKQAVTEQDLLTAKAKSQIAQIRLRELTAKLQAEQAAIDSLIHTLGANDAQFTVLQRITELLGENDVVLISQTFDEQPHISDFQKQALSQIESKRDGRKLEYRRFTLEGRYASVVAFLDDFSRSNVAAIPITVQLKTDSAKRGMHRWELVVVM